MENKRSTTGIKLESDDSAAVTLQDQHTEAFVLYLYNTAATPSITTDTAVDDESIEVDDSTGVVAGHAITIFDGGRIFQSIVTNVPDSTHIEFASPLDYPFTTAATVETGAYNLNVDGSTTPKEFSISPPTGIELDVTDIRVTFKSPSTIDPFEFGGISALTNGLVIRNVNGITKNNAVIINNTGLYEHGFELEYDDRGGGGGFYALRCKKNFPEVHGVTLRMTDDAGDSLKVKVQDNLTGLTQMIIVVLGHFTTESVPPTP